MAEAQAAGGSPKRDGRCCGVLITLGLGKGRRAFGTLHGVCPSELRYLIDHDGLGTLDGGACLAFFNLDSRRASPTDRPCAMPNPDVVMHQQRGAPRHANTALGTARERHSRLLMMSERRGGPVGRHLSGSTRPRRRTRTHQEQDGNRAKCMLYYIDTPWVLAIDCASCYGTTSGWFRGHPIGRVECATHPLACAAKSCI